MHWHFTPYVFPVLASAVVSSAPGATSFCLLMLAIAEWSLGYALELANPDLSSALWWDNFVWLGAICVPTLWLTFALSYTGRAGWLVRQNLALLIVEPFVTLLLVWTNGFHGLIESTVRLNTSGPFSSLVVTYGLWYWVNIAYSYLLLFLGAFILCSFILTVARFSHLFCIQGASLLIAMLAPWVANIVTTSGLNPFPHLDLTPFAFLISSLIFAQSLVLFRLLDIVPVAREMVIESMREAAIVLDAHNRVMDLNSAARRLVNFRASKAVGQPFAQVFSTWPELVGRCRNVVEVNEEVIIGVDEKKNETLRYFSLRISSLYRRNGHFAVTGRLVVLSDITERIQAERALKESEERFRNIFAEVPIGMAVADSEGHLLQVNRAFCEMLGYREQELIGRSISAITHPNDVGKDMLLAEQALKGEITSYRLEKRYLKKNHETLWADLTATLLRNQDGQAVYNLVMLENIIERKRAKLLEEERLLGIVPGPRCVRLRVPHDGQVGQGHVRHAWGGRGQ